MGGAHQSYSIFRAALELCEMVGADPEHGSDPSESEALVWFPNEKKTVADVARVTDNEVKIAALEAQLKAQQQINISHNAKIAALDAEIAAQNAKIAALEIQVSKLIGRIGEAI